MQVSAVLDIQCFQQSTDPKLIIKELTVLDTSTAAAFHWLFKPPPGPSQSDTPTNIWLRKKLHGIKWYDGEVDYKDLKDLLCSATKAFDVLFAKGLEKCKFLEGIIERPVYNLEYFGCPALKQLEDGLIKCHYHTDNPGYTCSLNQSHKLGEWIRKNQIKVDFYREEVRRATYGDATSPYNLFSFSGFIRGLADSVICFYCKLSFNTQSGVCPYSFHKKTNPDCFMFQNCY